MQLLEFVVDLVREYILKALDFNVMLRLKNQKIQLLLFVVYFELKLKS